MAKALAELHVSITRLDDIDDLPCGPAASLLLTSVVLNCDISLNQLADLLRKHGAANNRNMIAFLRSKLARQRADIDAFLEAAREQTIAGGKQGGNEAISDTTKPGTAAVTWPSCIEPELWDCFFIELRGEDQDCRKDGQHGQDSPREWQYISTADLLLSEQQSQSDDPLYNTTRLQPDSSGHEISPEATWTRIDRRLVSAQVLEQAGLRYEARRDFVSVLGSLPECQLRDLADRSAEKKGYYFPRGECRRRQGEEERDTQRWGPDRGLRDVQQVTDRRDG
ncbi:Nipped-B-like protein B [Ophiocordyceps camponoti-floridani]|uniref:Nipped-B-like protein B n=1 Tax=Ophiocordyceps camponoti-floridani TaxID=2030778 RepID=A0A8H4Q7P0_9HYPO|nr:Nipped-B-like protein B [Ophiocordyceps camponoti-floridani]